MLTLDDRLRVNENDVAAEVMEGEAIIINLATGVYYSMDGSGGFLWSRIEAGRRLGEIADALAQRYGIDRSRVEEDVVACARQLLDEGLVRTVSPDEVDGSEPAPAPDGSGEEYRPPSLEIYRDMEELLALDPPMPGLDAGGWEEDGEESVSAGGE